MAGALTLSTGQRSPEFCAARGPWSHRPQDVGRPGQATTRRPAAVAGCTCARGAPQV